MTKRTFTSSEIEGEGESQCAIFFKILVAHSMKPNKLKRHLETTFGKQNSNIQKALTLRALLALSKVGQEIAKCRKPHTITEQLILQAIIDMTETMLGESCAKHSAVKRYNTCGY